MARLGAKRNSSRYTRETGKPWNPNLLFSLHQASEQTVSVGGSSIPKYYFHMTHVAKVGFNYRPTYGDTPLGIYAYPLDSKHLSDLLNRQLPYLSDANFISALELQSPSQCMLLGARGPGKEYEKLKSKLPGALNPRKYLNIIIEELIDCPLRGTGVKYARVELVLRELRNIYALIVDFPAYLGSAKSSLETLIREYPDVFALIPELRDQLVYVGTKPVSDRERAKIFRSLIVRAGYTSVYDPNTGTIHAGEPHQIAFLTLDSFKLVGQFTQSELNRLKDKNYELLVKSKSTVPKDDQARKKIDQQIKLNKAVALRLIEMLFLSFRGLAELKSQFRPFRSIDISFRPLHTWKVVDYEGMESDDAVSARGTVKCGDESINLDIIQVYRGSQVDFCIDLSALSFRELNESVIDLLGFNAHPIFGDRVYFELESNRDDYGPFPPTPNYKWLEEERRLVKLKSTPALNIHVDEHGTLHYV